MQLFRVLSFSWNSGDAIVDVSASGDLAISGAEPISTRAGSSSAPTGGGPCAPDAAAAAAAAAAARFARGAARGAVVLLRLPARLCIDPAVPGRRSGACLGKGTRPKVTLAVDKLRMAKHEWYE